MQFFRRMMQSKIGGYVALALLALMAFAFVAGDITGKAGGFNFLGASGSTVAEINGADITTAELQTAVQRFYRQAQTRNPELTMADFLKQGAVKQTLDSMISIKSLIAYGEKHGMRVSKKLIDAEIAGTQAFADATGTFSENQFKSILSQQGLTEKEVREDFAGQIMRQHLLMPAAAAVRTPESMVPPYAAMLIELREGQQFAIPSQHFAPTRAPTDAELQAYYKANPGDFSLPEQRKLRYALISRDRFDAQAAPTDKDIADAYKQRAADFAARESRDFSQLILPTEKQAKDMVAKAGATPLADLARTMGLSTSNFKGVDQKALGEQVSADAAKAAFAASKGQLIGPFRTSLGWALIHVDDVRTIAGKTLEQAKAELVPKLREQRVKELFADFLNTLDGKLGEGATLQEIAKTNNLQVVETTYLTADGRNLKDPAFKADATITALAKAGFGMNPADDPQIVQVQPDTQAALIVPGDSIPAGPPPLADVRAAAESGWRLSQGAALARAAANKAVQLMNKGVVPEEAMKQAGAAGLPMQPIGFRRIQLSQQQPGQQVPPQLRALLTMKLNGAQVVGMEKNLGFVVVRLNKITQQDPRADQSLMQSTRQGLAGVLGGEYMLQLSSAIEKDLNVKRYPAAIAAVEQALHGDGAQR